MLKKGDIIVTAIILVISVVLAFALFFGGGQAMSAEIYVDGSLYQSLSLKADNTVVIAEQDRQAVIEIKNGSVRMLSSSCKDQYCVHQGSINKAGQSIICLPQRIVVTLKGRPEYDAITG